MSPLPPPPIGEPESLGELARLVSYSLGTISNSLDDLNRRFDKLVTEEKHQADVAALKREISDVRSNCDRYAATTKWAISSLISVLVIVATVWLALAGYH